MSLIIVLFVAGVFLIALEVVVPGGILGTIGSLFMLAGVVVSFDRFGFSGGAAATAAGLLIGCVALYFEFVLLPKSRIARALSMTATVHGRSQPAVADRALIGRPRRRGDHARAEWVSSNATAAATRPSRAPAMSRPEAPST
jgi:membrane-bound ClpP family serine protease